MMTMTMLVPLALGLAAALVYLASANARVSELARIVFFFCAGCVIWRLFAAWVHL